MLKTIVTDFSLEGCCLFGYFQRGEIIDLCIRTIGRFQAQVQWVKLGKAGARFLSIRATASSPHAARQQSLAQDSRGVAAIEYAFIAALIAVSLVAAFSLLGARVSEHYGNVSSAVADPSTSYESGNEV